VFLLLTLRLLFQVIVVVGFVDSDPGHVRPSRARLDAMQRDPRVTEERLQPIDAATMSWSS
jgi:hypothetical protein